MQTLINRFQDGFRNINKQPSFPSFFWFLRATKPKQRSYLQEGYKSFDAKAAVRTCWEPCSNLANSTKHCYNELAIIKDSHPPKCLNFLFIFHEMNVIRSVLEIFLPRHIFILLLNPNQKLIFVVVAISWYKNWSGQIYDLFCFWGVTIYCLKSLPTTKADLQVDIFVMIVETSCSLINTLLWENSKMAKCYYCHIDSFMLVQQHYIKMTSM